MSCAYRTSSIIIYISFCKCTSVSYSYDGRTLVSTTDAWHDQLKCYNNTVISYVASGNPTNYLGKEMTWQGPLLKTIAGVAMTYDLNGLRTTKGNKRYYWQNGNLIMECWTDNGVENYIYYYYDNSGVCGFKYNGEEYYYRKNIFGDIIAIYDNFANLKCRYVYDAWGNCKLYDEYNNLLTEESQNIGNINPLLYRSYYWDKEFGLYYLQTRYYDPVLGRFLSPDNVNYLDPETINGLNLYAYCNNDPITVNNSKFKVSPFVSNTIINSTNLNKTNSASFHSIKKRQINPLGFSIGLITPENYDMPLWMSAYACYIKGTLGWGYTLGDGYSFASFSAGVLDAVFQTPKWFNFLPDEHLLIQIYILALELGRSMLQLDLVYQEQPKLFRVPLEFNSAML